MLTLADTVRAVDQFLQSEPVSTALTFHTPVQFDSTLIRRLIDAHGALNAHFASLVCRLGDEPESAISAIRECARRLHELRRTEALWLYPVIARGVENDAAARRELVQLRLVMLTLVRRVLRRFDELLQAVTQGAPTVPLAEQVSAALAEYVRRNEAEIYPLYDIVSLRNSQRAYASA